MGRNTGNIISGERTKIFKNREDMKLIYLQKIPKRGVSHVDSFFLQIFLYQDLPDRLASRHNIGISGDIHRFSFIIRDFSTRFFHKQYSGCIIPGF